MRGRYQTLDIRQEITCCVRSETDGSVDPTSLTTAYLRGATQRGATLAEGCRVQEVVVEAGRVAGVRSVVAAAAS